MPDWMSDYLALGEAPVASVSPTPAKGKGKRSAGSAVGEEHGEVGPKRKWLRAYETAPAQWLNVYGASQYVDKSNREVFTRASESLKHVEWGTEMASKGVERRGVSVSTEVCML